MMEPTIEISWKTLWRIAIFGACLAVLYFAREAIGVFAVAVVFALGFDPAVDFMQKRGIPRILGTLLIFLSGIGAVLLIAYFLFPVILLELGGFLEHFNDTLNSLFGISVFSSAFKELGTSLKDAFFAFSNSKISITSAVGFFVKEIILILATIVVMFYLMIEKDGIERFLRVILSDSYEKQTLSVFNKFKIKIRKWLSTQLFLSVIMGVLVSFGMWALGVEYPLLLGVLAAALEVVPVIGPIVVGCVAFLIASSTSVPLAVYTVVFFFVLQQIENHVFVPIVIGKSMKVHPIVVIVSLIAGGRIAGFVGILLAVPIAVLVQEIFDYFAEKKERRQKMGLY